MISGAEVLGVQPVRHGFAAGLFDFRFLCAVCAGGAVASTASPRASQMTQQWLMRETHNLRENSPPGSTRAWLATR